MATKYVRNELQYEDDASNLAMALLLYGTMKITALRCDSSIGDRIRRVKKPRIVADGGALEVWDDNGSHGGPGEYVAGFWLITYFEVEDAQD